MSKRIDKARRTLYERYTINDINIRGLARDDLLWVINHHPNVDVAIAALRRLAVEEQPWIAILAGSHEHEDVRAEAVALHHDQRLKVRHALADPSLKVRKAAVIGITAPPHLEEMSQSQFVDVRLAYLAKLGIFAPRFYTLLQRDESPKVRKRAKKILDEHEAKTRNTSAKLTRDATPIPAKHRPN